MSPRWATTGVFLVNGAAIGTWVAQIPWIQQRFDLSESAIGLVIAGMSLAVVIAFPIAGQAVVKHGSERMVWIGGIATALAVSLPVLAPEPVLVAAGLFVLGGSSATMDVSMNSHGVGVERCLERPIMSSLHAGWAFGGMAGAPLPALMSALGAVARGRSARRALPAGDADGGCDGRLGRPLPEPGPRHADRRGGAGLRVLHGRHDGRAPVRRLDQPARGAGDAAPVGGAAHRDPAGGNAADRPPGSGAARAVRHRAGGVERSAVDVQRGRPAAGHTYRAGVLDARRECRYHGPARRIRARFPGVEVCRRRVPRLPRAAIVGECDPR